MRSNRLAFAGLTARGARRPGRELRPVALATYVRLRDPARAEVAFAVADDLHGRGIATRLLERLAVHASAAGVQRFVAEVLPQNTAMLRVFDDAGFATSRVLQDGVVEVLLSLGDGRGFERRRDERDHLGVTASLRPFFSPASVAVIGASARRGTIGGELFRNVLQADFTGAAYPVNRGGEPVGGVGGYASIADVPAPVDLAVICAPGERVLDAVQGALTAGVKAICVISAGFAEMGAEGAVRQDEFWHSCAPRRTPDRAELPRDRRYRPAPERDLRASRGSAGRAAFSSQSGALGLALLGCRRRGLGLSSFVSIGNKADVSSNDLLEYWEDDEATDVILLTSSRSEPAQVARVAGRFARSKPILAMRSAPAAPARGASSHGGSCRLRRRCRSALLAGGHPCAHARGAARHRVLLSSQPLPAGNASPCSERRGLAFSARTLATLQARAAAARRGDPGEASALDAGRGKPSNR